jgi:hypothetical protein
MKRVWGHVLVGLAAISAGAAVTTACTHDDSSMFVLDVLAPQLVSNGAACFFTSDPTQPFISSGTLDVGLAGEYNAEYLVGNQLIQQGNTDQLRTETSRITVQGAIVRITDANGNQLKTYTRLTAGTVQPGSGADPGYAPFNVTTIDNGTASSIKPARGALVRLITYVRFFGQTLGGQHVESNEFEFPVDVCNGCLVRVSQMDFSATAGTTMLPLPCFPGQDFAIDCSQCDAPVCVATCPSFDAGGG